MSGKTFAGMVMYVLVVMIVVCALAILAVELA